MRVSRFLRATCSPSGFLFISLGAALLSCGDDESGTGGCDGSCSHGWTLCEEPLVAQGADQKTFATECGDQCRSLSQTDERALSIALSCVSQAKTCQAVRDCADLGSVFGTGGLTGTGGRGTGGYGTGGYGTGAYYIGTGGYDTGGYYATGGYGTGGYGTGGTSGNGGTGSGGVPTCLDICYLAHNSQCNDGRPGATDARCAPGTDCFDCGTFNPETGGVTGSGGAGNGGDFGMGGIPGTGGLASGGVSNAGGSDGGLSSGGTLGSGGADGGSSSGGALSTGGAASGGAPGTGGVGTGGAGTGGAGTGGAGTGGVTGSGGSGTGGTSGMLCTNTCSSAGNSICGDSGPGSTADVCPYGTDCTDCGARTPGTSGLCSNSCVQKARNGSCNDGSQPCSIGSDCADCGPR
jgi:hypothetical protein